MSINRSQMVYVLLQNPIVFKHNRSVFCANITEMPWLVDYMGYVLFVVGVTKDKTKTMGILGKPNALGSLAESSR
jgi:hypothetical protein